MRKIGDEINTASGGALELPDSKPRVLDLCMAPGGYTASALKHSPHANVCAFTLPTNFGGHKIFHRRDERLKTRFGDITMLYKEFGLTELPLDHPESSNFSDQRLCNEGELFDLVFCDGQALRTHKQYIADYRQQVEAVRLTVSQLVLAMQRMKSGGTLIMLLHDIGSYETIKILSVFDKVADIQLFKPVSAHRKKSSFYLIAQKVQPGLPEAVAAVNEWKMVWKDLTFPALDPHGQRVPLNEVDEAERMEAVHGLLEDFARRVIELGEPIWKMQKEALENAPWTKKKEEKRASDLEEVDSGEASTTATNNAMLDAHDSEKDGDDTEASHDKENTPAEAPRDEGTAPVSVKSPDSMANGPADSADVSVAMQSLDIERCDC